MIAWYETKQFVAQATAISMDALHVILGAVLLLALALVLRRPVADPRPWFALLTLTLLNEAADMWAELWPSPGMQLGEAAKDVTITMFLPTLVLLSARYLPRLYAGTARREGAPDSGDQQLGGRSPTAS